MFAALPAYATTTVTGHIQNLSGGVVSSGTFVRFWLRGCGGNQPRVNGTSLIAPSQGGVFYFDMVPDSSGTVTGTLYSTRASNGTSGGDIECGGSTTSVWYGMQIWVNGKSGPETPIAANNGASIDLSSITPLSQTPAPPAPPAICVSGGSDPGCGQGVTPGGAANDVQMNNGVGGFTGSANFSWDGSNLHIGSASGGNQNYTVGQDNIVSSGVQSAGFFGGLNGSTSNGTTPPNVIFGYGEDNVFRSDVGSSGAPSNLFGFGQSNALYASTGTHIVNLAFGFGYLNSLYTATADTQRAFAFGYNNTVHDCLDCYAFGENAVVTTSHFIGLGLSSAPELQITPANIAVAPSTVVDFSAGASLKLPGIAGVAAQAQTIGYDTTWNNYIGYVSGLGYGVEFPVMFQATAGSVSAKPGEMPAFKNDSSAGSVDDASEMVPSGLVSGFTGGGHRVTLSGTITADRTLTVPDASGTLCINSNCPSVVQFTNTNLASNVSCSATTVCSVQAVTLSALPSACATNGCRIEVIYSYLIYGGTFGTLWVDDGTNTGGIGYFDTNTNFSGASASYISRSQYSSGATPTITIKGNDGGSYTVCSTMGTGGGTCGTAPTSTPTITGGVQIKVFLSAN